MRKIRLLQGGSVRHQFDASGLSRQPLMPEANEEAKLFECTLKAGCVWEPPLFPFRKKIQMFFFTNQTGFVRTETQSWNIEQGVFVPDYDRETVVLHAGAQDLHFLHIVGDLNDYDRETMANWCIKLPRFRNFDQCVQYTEGFTGDAGSNVTSRLLVEGRACGRWSMGWNEGMGPTFIGEHVHKHLVQWYYVLPDGSFTYIAGGDEQDLGPGSLSYTEANTPHGSRSAEGKRINYIWLELATNGYPVGPDGFPGL